MRKLLSSILGKLGLGNSKNDRTPDVVYIQQDDEELIEAMEKAQQTLDDFIEVFENPTKKQDSFAIKIAIKDGDDVEHFWVEIFDFNGRQFKGYLSNEPAIVGTVQQGDKISTSKDKVEDWMYVEKGKLVGGYTIKILRKRLSPTERKQLDKAVPYMIE
jgi:uncharacterized protein YegJ (DUF2314 family)